MEDLPPRGTNPDEKTGESADGSLKSKKRELSQGSQPPKSAVTVEDSSDPNDKAVESEDGGMRRMKENLSGASRPPKSFIMEDDSPELNERPVENGGQKDLSKASKCSKFQTLILGSVQKFFTCWVSTTH